MRLLRMEGTYVLIGNSAAALAAIDGIRKYDPTGSILLINREHGPAYSRVALPYYVAGEIGLDDLLIRQHDDYLQRGVKLVEDAAVSSIDAGTKQVLIEDGRTVRYQKLLISTGSVCTVPPISGLETVPYHSLWTLDDAKTMKAAAEQAQTAVVIGGGFIGMLAAEALRRRGIRLTIVEMLPQLLPQLLDAGGGRLFSQVVVNAGVRLRLGSVVEEVATDSGQISARLKGGETLAADMIVVAAGVTPNVACLRDGPCAVNRGVLVDEHLQTECPDIYAAGDVAEVKDFLSGDRTIHAIWPSAVDQGRIAGANMAGQCLTYPGSLGMNVVRLFNITLAQVGRFQEAPSDTVRWLGTRSGALYRKVVVDRDGVLAGAMYLGDGNGVGEIGVIHGMIKRRARWRECAGCRMPRVTYPTATTVRGRAAPIPLEVA